MHARDTHTEDRSHAAQAASASCAGRSFHARATTATKCASGASHCACRGPDLLQLAHVSGFDWGLASDLRKAADAADVSAV